MFKPYRLFSRSEKDPRWGAVAPLQLQFATVEEAEVVAERWRKAHPNSEFEVRKLKGILMRNMRDFDKL